MEYECRRLRIFLAMFSLLCAVSSGIDTHEFLTGTTSYVYHMEVDLLDPRCIIHTDQHAMATSNEKESIIVTGNPMQSGYLERVGKYARFNLITDFIQLNKTRILIVDQNNHCIRLFDWSLGTTSRFAGACKRRLGFQDGVGYEAKFYYPHSIIRDKTYPDNFLVVDIGNSAVRTLGLNSKVVGTLVKADVLRDITDIEQDSGSGDILVLSGHVIHRYTQSTKELTPLAGSTQGYRDGRLHFALFQSSYDIIEVGKATFLVADRGNSLVRVVDINANNVSTLRLCSEMNTKKSTDLTSSPCTIPALHALLAHNKSLLIGSDRKILKAKHILKNQSVPTKESNDDSDNTTLTIIEEVNGNSTGVRLHNGSTIELTGGNYRLVTENNNYQLRLEKNLTNNVTDGRICPSEIQATTSIASGLASVKIRSYTLLLPVGKYPLSLNGSNCSQALIRVAAAHIFTNRSALRNLSNADHCEITLTIIDKVNGNPAGVRLHNGSIVKLTAGTYRLVRKDNNYQLGLKNNLTENVTDQRICPSAIRAISSNQSGLASVTIQSHALLLPPGKYPLSLGGSNCSQVVITVADHRLRRRLVFKANYNIVCSSISDPFSRSTIEAITKQNYKQVEEVCMQDCRRQANADPVLRCSKDLLTVEWMTDLTFAAHVTKVPSELRSRLHQRLSAKGSAFYIVLLRQPPTVINPRKNADGTLATPTLNSYCTQELIYDAETDMCV